MLTAQGAYWVAKGNFEKKQEEVKKEIAAVVDEAVLRGRFEVYYERKYWMRYN